MQAHESSEFKYSFVQFAYTEMKEHAFTCYEKDGPRDVLLYNNEVAITFTTRGYYINKGLYQRFIFFLASK